MTDTAFCQSCLMPIDNDEVKGTNSDGSLSDDYCTHCYQNGAFTSDISMNDMIEGNLQHLDEWNKSAGLNMTEDEARAQLQQLMPTLKRWA